MCSFEGTISQDKERYVGIEGRTLPKLSFTKYFFLSKIKDFEEKASGDDDMKVTPVPIPNTKVKLHGANGTAGEALWESRKLPG